MLDDDSRQFIRFHPRAGSPTATADPRVPTNPCTPLYVHIPFCTTRCHFCDFVIVVGRNTPDSVIDRYIGALFDEMESFFATGPLSERLAPSSQIGGGTPTYLSASQIERVLSFLEHASAHVETRSTLIEGFPASISEDKLEVIGGFPSAQLNIGVQTFSDELLSNVGRQHEASRALSAIRGARQAEIGSIGIDLIYGLPGSTVSSARADVGHGLDEGVNHVTLYPLWVYEGTPLSRRISQGRLSDVSVEEKVDQFDAMNESLRAAGFERYTAFHYARTPADQHRYGLAQMQGSDWMGFGQGSISQLGDLVFQNKEDLGAYCSAVENGEEVAEAQRLSRRAHMSRTLSHLIRRGSVDSETYVRRFGESVERSFSAEIERLHDDGLIEMRDGTIALTALGTVCIGLVESVLFERS